MTSTIGIRTCLIDSCFYSFLFFIFFYLSNLLSNFFILLIGTATLIFLLFNFLFWDTILFSLLEIFFGNDLMFSLAAIITSIGSKLGARISTWACSRVCLAFFYEQNCWKFCSESDRKFSF